MRLAASQIGWRPDQDLAAFDLLRAQGLLDWEAVPSRIAGRTLPQDLRVGAFQSLFFGGPPVQVFQEATWPALTGLLEDQFALAQSLGCHHLVLGAPSQRRIPEGVPPEWAEAQALALFRTLGAAAAMRECVLLLEPAPPSYGCNFLRTHPEAAAFVERVASPGIGLHWDTGTLLSEPAVDWGFLREHLGRARHVHLSLPRLEAGFGECQPFFRTFLDLLARTGFDGLASVEMKSGEGDLAGLASALSTFRDLLHGL
jgi:sugar phosphate isomerase/epimerase